MSDYEAYRTAWRRRWGEEARLGEQRRRGAQAYAQRLANLLATEYEVKKVILFGSALAPGAFRENSDIDLAVEGLSKERFFEAYGTLSWSSPYDVDLKPIENLTPLIQARVREGSVLYEARESS